MPERSALPTASLDLPDLSERRVLVPGGTGGVGEGVVRAYLAAGADVVVPTRSQRRAEEFRGVVAGAAVERLHLVVHDYSTFAGAAQLAEEVVGRFGALDDVVAPIGGWWAGKQLWQIDDTDWRSAFIDLTTTHIAVARACLPRMQAHGAYTIIVGTSASTPIPGSGLVSMEQAALLMMQQVLEVEVAGAQRVFALVLGPVRTRQMEAGDPDRVSAEQVGVITVAASASVAGGRALQVSSQADVDQALALLRTASPGRIGSAQTMR